MIPVIAVIVLGLLLANGLGWLAVILGAVGALLYLRWDVRRHPAVPCRRCSGGGDHYSLLGGQGRIRKPLGDCRRCGGRKVFPRFAARFFDPETRQDMIARIRKGREKI